MALRGPVGRGFRGFSWSVLGRGCESEGANAGNRADAHFEICPIFEKSFGADARVDDTNKCCSDEAWSNVAFSFDSNGYEDDGNSCDDRVDDKIDPALDTVEKIGRLL